MVEEVLPGLYRIEIPLPRSPLKALNSYLIKDKSRCLIIDTGMNREECRRQMFSALARLDVDLKRTDFFITHLHVDHLGLVATLATDMSRIYFNQLEADIVNSGWRWEAVSTLYRASGFPEEELKKSLAGHPGRRYGPGDQVNFHILREGDKVEAGDYSFSCLDTPGHTPGHMCLYEANKKILISGDHILFDITPNITVWPEMENPLKDYLVNLEKVYPLEVKLVLPGHRRIWNNHQGRIRELQQHHQTRLSEIISALREEDKTAFQIAPYITWDVDYPSWEKFPAPQKWFAVGETLAHLKYLEEDGRLQRKTKAGKIVFSLK